MSFLTERALALHTLSPAMQSVDNAAVRAAASDATILVVGEPGSGKNTMAYRLHELSARAGRTMVSSNCSTMTDTLFSLELFGRGDDAYPGIGPARAGLLADAEGGTLFLDEVGLSSPVVQRILSRLLTTRETPRVHGLPPRPIDVRFIAATECNLEAKVADRSFRRDLYHLVGEVSLAIPPLRERRSEIPELARLFVAEQCAVIGRPDLSITPAALTVLNDHIWIDNILTLKSAMQRAVVLCEGSEIRPEHLPRAAEGNGNRNARADSR